MNFFGKAAAPEKKEKQSTDPVDQAKQWKRNLQREINHMTRDITNLKRAEEKALKECKKLAQGGNLKAAKIMAREIVNTRKQIDRMYAANAQLNSVQMMLQTSISMLKMQGIMGKSVEIMHTMNQLINLPELKATMSSMAREMERAGLIDELVGDTMDALDTEGVEAEADAAVDKVIQELTTGVLDGASAAPTSKVPVKPAAAARAVTGAASAASASAAAAEPEAEAEDEEMNEEEMSAMRARLQAL